jgi:hypothetical protein
MLYVVSFISHCLTKYRAARHWTYDVESTFYKLAGVIGCVFFLGEYDP